MTGKGLLSLFTKLVQKSYQVHSLKTFTVRCHKLHKKMYLHFERFGQEHMWPCWEYLLAEQNFAVLHCGNYK